MRNVYDVLEERGFIKQTVFKDELYEKLANEQVTFYIGFDPTADSLHIGHFIPLMAMAHMQRHGHRPIALIGGGTAMVGDPSGRCDMRSMMTKEKIADNVQCFKKQISRFIDFSDGKALLLDNADWLTKLNYVDFLREVGACFSVNKMLTAECFKQRMEKGLSFLEFNYMLMQSYDFYVLHEKYGCSLQVGGDDQWSNMLGGADLIRRKKQDTAYALTCSLLLTSDGHKMGKTAKGALWLSADKTSPYEFFQYWRNIEDQSVENCFKLLTFLPLEEIEELVKYKDQRINLAKERLAYEITKLIHGEENAKTALEQARSAFSGQGDNMPTSKMAKTNSIVDVLICANVAKSRGEARRLIDQGCVFVNEQKVPSFDWQIPESEMEENQFILHKGKKVHVKIVFE